MDSASARVIVIGELIRERHLDPNRASWAALAMFPFDDSVKTGRRFRKDARRVADLYANRLAEVPDEMVETLTLATLEQLRDIATDSGEAYHADQYAGVLAAAAADPNTPTLERKCGSCDQWFEGFEDQCSACGTPRRHVTISTVQPPENQMLGAAPAEVEPLNNGDADEEDGDAGDENGDAGEEMLDAVRHFFADDDWPLEEPSEGVLVSGFTGQNGSWRVFVQAPGGYLRVLSVLNDAVPEKRRIAVSELLTRANRAILVGNFELDFTDGEVRFRTSVDLTETLESLTQSLIYNLVYGNVGETDHYYPAVMGVVHGARSPKDALALVED